MLATIGIKRVYEPPGQDDGIRILVDRLWPRGLSKEAAAIDLWSKDLAPSTPLRKWFGHLPERFEEFSRLYREELAANPAVASVLGSIGRKRATLLYAAKDPKINHAVILADHLRQR